MRTGLPVVVLCAVVSACGNPSGPSRSGSYEGQWSGTTAQGRTVTFSISADEKVTTITLGHEFNGCSGSQTFPSLDLTIAPRVECIPAPCPGMLTAYRVRLLGWQSRRGSVDESQRPVHVERSRGGHG